MTTLDPPLTAPEAPLLAAALRSRRLARLLARASADWRDLSAHELDHLGLAERDQRAVLALQILVRKTYPELPELTIIQPDQVVDLYSQRLGALVNEVMIALALNGRHQLLAEIEVARGGRHALVVSIADIIRPLVRVGASGFILVHNHPSGDATPSGPDITMTRALVRATDTLGLTLVDHIIIAGRGRGHSSMHSLGLLSHSE